MPTKRQLQLGETIRRDFSIVLQEQGPYLYGTDVLVSITTVQMSPDLGIAKIYLSVYNTINKQEVILMMKDNTKSLKAQLYQRIRKRVRRVPVLQFYLDETLDEMDYLNDLFNKINKKDA